MPRVPFPTAPSVGLSVPGMVPMQAPGVQPVEDQSGKQIQQLGAQTFEVGMGLWKISQEEQDQIDTAQAKELDNQIAEAYRNEVQNFTSLTGKDAVDARESVMKRLQEKRKEIEGKAITPGQKAMVGLNSDRRTIAAVADVTEHFQKQQRTWNLGVSQARAQGFGVDAARYAAAGKADEYATAKRNMDAEVLHGLSLEGIPADSEPAKMLLLKRQTELHEGIVKMLAQQNPPLAEKHLADNAAEIAPEKLAELQDITKTASVADKSLRTSTAIVAEMGKQGGTLAEQRAKAVDTALWSWKGGKLSAKEYDETVKRLNLHYQEQDRRNDADKLATQAEVMRVLALPENLGKRLVDFPELHRKVVMHGVLPEMQSFEENRRVTSIPGLVTELYGAEQAGMLSSIDVEKFRAENIGRLSPAALDRWSEKMMSAQGKADKVVNRRVDHSKRFRTAARVVGWLHSNMTDQETTDLELREQSFMDNIPENATDKDVDVMIDAIYKAKAEMRSGGEVLSVKITPEQRASGNVGYTAVGKFWTLQEAQNLMPTGVDLLMVQRELRAQRMPETDQNIFRFWVTGLVRDGKLKVTPEDVVQQAREQSARLPRFGWAEPGNMRGAR